jgi:hypothetical protein
MLVFTNTNSHAHSVINMVRHVTRWGKRNNPGVTVPEQKDIMADESSSEPLTLGGWRIPQPRLCAERIIHNTDPLYSVSSVLKIDSDPETRYAHTTSCQSF